MVPEMTRYLQSATHLDFSSGGTLFSPTPLPNSLTVLFAALLPPTLLFAALITFPMSQT